VSRAGHRRVPGGYLARSVLRQLCTVTALTVLYFVLPLDGGRAGSALAVLVVGLLGFGVLAAWQVRAVLGSPYPVVRAFEALAAAVPLYLLLFAAAYVLMSIDTPAAFSEDLDRIDALYFTMTVFATVGFGDIAPVTPTARAVVLGQMVANLVVLGLLLRVVAGAIRVNRDRRSGSDRPE
jgi:hypothetical protein